MNILVTICARGGSKGVPDKNIKKIANKPLIYYTLNLIFELKKNKNFKNIDVVLSTDSQKIKNIVAEFKGIDIDIDYIRPAYLATDKAGKLDAIIDVKQFMTDKNKKRYDYVLDLDVTSPLRTVKDISESFEKLKINKSALNIFSVNIASKNPYFNLVEKKDDNFFSLSKKGRFLSRQVAPKVYELNASFYFYKDSFFRNECKTVITEKSLIYEMKHICFDIDHPIDFDFMEYLIENNKLGFKL